MDYKITEIDAKKLITHVKGNDTWFGLKYNMNLYRGCQHGCIYCDSRSECYRIDNFDSEILVKSNTFDLLERELRSKKIRGTVGFGSMNDPYMPIELKYNLVGRSLKLMEKYRFPVHILTKSNLVLRDIDILDKISSIYSAVSFTITTSSDEQAKLIEPGAPLSSERFQAMKIISGTGILTGTLLMPVLPYITDSKENIVEIVRKTKENGGKYVLPAFGLTMRDRQKEFLFQKLGKIDQGLEEIYRNKFNNSYSVGATKVASLKKLFYETCKQYELLTYIPKYKPNTVEQLSLFGDYLDG